MNRKLLPKEKQQLLKQALREINSFAKAGNFVFTPKTEEGEKPDAEKTKLQI